MFRLNISFKAIKTKNFLNFNLMKNISNDIKDTSNTQTKRYSFDEMEEILVKLKNMDLAFEDLPDQLKPFQKELETIITTHKIIDPNTCCGSGCGNCILIEYEENFETFAPVLRDITNRVNESHKNTNI